MQTWRDVLLFAALVLVGLLAGSTLAVWQGYDPHALSPGAWVEVHQGAVRGLNFLVPALGWGGAVSTLALAWLSRGSPRARSLLLAAVVCIVAGGIVTLVVNQPINAIVMHWTPSQFPPDWPALRDRWWQWHVVRTVLAIGALAFLAGAVASLHPVSPRGDARRSGVPPDRRQPPFGSRAAR